MSVDKSVPRTLLGDKMRRGIEESAATGLKLRQTFDVLCCCGIFSGDEFGQKLKILFGISDRFIKMIAPFT